MQRVQADCQYRRSLLSANEMAGLCIAADAAPTFLKTTHKQQGIHRHQTPPWYRNATSHTLPYGPLRPNVTSSIQLEAHNVSQRRQRRTEIWPQGMCTTNFVKIGPAVPDICSQTDRHMHMHRHTDRQTDRNTPLPYQGRLITIHATNGAPNLFYFCTVPVITAVLICIVQNSQQCMVAKYSLFIHK